MNLSLKSHIKQYMEKRGQQLTGPQTGCRVKTMWFFWGRVDWPPIKMCGSGLWCLWFKTSEHRLPLETRFPLSSFFFLTQNTTSLTEKWNSYILDMGETHFKISNKLFQKLFLVFFPLYLIWVLTAVSTHHFTFWFYTIKKIYTVEQMSWICIKSVCTWRENIKMFMSSASVTKVLELKYPSLVISVFIFFFSLLFSSFLLSEVFDKPFLNTLLWPESCTIM